MTLPAFAAERRRLQHGARSYLLPAGRWATNPPASVAAVDRWDRQTDGRTDGHPTVTKTLLSIRAASITMSPGR